MNVCGHDIKVEECGLHLLPECSFLGASSDGTVIDSSLDDLCCGCLEIKCPFSCNNRPVMDISPKEIVRQFPTYSSMELGDDGNLHLKEKHKFYDQVMGEMAILGADWCDFVVFTNAGIAVDQIAFD